MKKKKSIVGQLLLYFCTILAIFITISGILNATTMEGFFFQLMFFPITFFLAKSSFDQIILKKSTAPNITKKSKSFFVTSIIIFFLLMFIGLRSVARSMKNQENEIATITLDENNKTIMVDTSENEDNKNIIIIKADNPKAIINVRETPSDTSPIINQARVGQEFEFLSTKDDWYEITIDEKTIGWIKADSTIKKE